MASRAAQISRNLFGFEFRRLFATAATIAVAGEDRTARAFAGAGLGALLALPLLLLLSVAFAVPMAVPAVIGVGYLALSQALVGEHYRRADFITACVFGSLVGWVLLYALTGEGQFSPVEMTAALVAPIIAAAPAALRPLISWRDKTPERTPDVLRQAALERVACLNELTPCEQVLMLDLEGSVLAATAAARQSFQLLPKGFEHHLSSLFEDDDLTKSSTRSGGSWRTPSSAHLVRCAQTTVQRSKSKS